MMIYDLMKIDNILDLRLTYEPKAFLLSSISIFVLNTMGPTICSTREWEVNWVWTLWTEGLG